MCVCVCIYTYREQVKNTVLPPCMMMVIIIIIIFICGELQGTNQRSAYKETN